MDSSKWDVGSDLNDSNYGTELMLHGRMFRAFYLPLRTICHKLSLEEPRHSFSLVECCFECLTRCAHRTLWRYNLE